MSEKNLLTVVVLASLAAAGYFIWQHKKATTVAPAPGAAMQSAADKLQNSGIAAGTDLAGKSITGVAHELIGLFDATPAPPAQPSAGSYYSQIGSGDASYTLASDQESTYSESGDYTS